MTIAAFAIGFCLGAIVVACVVVLAVCEARS